MTSPGELLRRLAVPRLAGSVAQAHLLPLLEAELAARGLAVTRHACTVAPTSLAFTAFLGVTLALSALAGGLLPWLDPTPRVAANAVLLLAGFALLVGAIPAWRRAMAADLGARAVGGVNLVAQRPGDTPRVWLTAHHDSKGQPLSMAGRLVAAGLAGGGGVTLLALATLQRGGVPADPAVWTAAAVPAALGGVGLYVCGRLGDSPGAVDNASGILTVLAVLDALPDQAGVGVILPDGEEFGFEGARALVRSQAALFRDAAVINFDGIDDRGPTIAFMHRPGPLVAAVAAALGARRARRLPVIVDGMVFARAAAQCVTVLRGGWDTMTVVHTRRDTAERLTLAGVREVAERVARALASH